MRNLRQAPKVSDKKSRDQRWFGRKNYLFVGSEAGGKAAAIAYTLIETAKLNAVDSHAWLADTIARMPDYKITRVYDLLPWRWNG